MPWTGLCMECRAFVCIVFPSKSTNVIIAAYVLLSTAEPCCSVPCIIMYLHRMLVVTPLGVLFFFCLTIRHEYWDASTSESRHHPIQYRPLSLSTEVAFPASSATVALGIAQNQTTNQPEEVPACTGYRGNFFVIWEGPLPNRYLHALGTIFRHNPCARVKLYSNSVALEVFNQFLRGGFSIEVCPYNLLDMAAQLPFGSWTKIVKQLEDSVAAHRADLLRLILVYLYGGLYSDIDQIWMRPIDFDSFIVVGSYYTDNGHCLQDRSQLSNEEFQGSSCLVISNGIFAAHARNDWLKEALKALPEVYSARCWDCVGSQLLTQAYNNAPMHRIKAVPAELVYGVPPAWLHELCTPSVSVRHVWLHEAAYGLHLYGSYTFHYVLEEGSVYASAFQNNTVLLSGTRELLTSLNIHVRAADWIEVGTADYNTLAQQHVGGGFRVGISVEPSSELLHHLPRPTDVRSTHHRLQAALSDSDGFADLYSVRPDLTCRPPLETCALQCNQTGLFEAGLSRCLPFFLRGASALDHVPPSLNKWLKAGQTAGLSKQRVPTMRWATLVRQYNLTIVRFLKISCDSSLGILHQVIEYAPHVHPEVLSVNTGAWKPRDHAAIGKQLQGAHYQCRGRDPLVCKYMWKWSEEKKKGRKA